MKRPEDQDEERSNTPEAERARGALRRASAPRADRAFRERLREEFVSGRIAGHEGAERERLPGRVLAPAPPLPWYRRQAARAALLAAAASLAFLVGAILNRGPEWTVPTASGTGLVRVDGDAVPIESLEVLRERIRPGAEIAIPETGTLELMAARTILLELTPGTRLTVPPPPARWVGRNAEIYARAGVLRATTGPDFHGANLAIHTPEAVARVTGTTFTVIMERTGTCVCVLEGVVEVGRQGEHMMRVPSGHRGYVFRDRRPSEMAEIRPTELVELARFRSTRLHALSAE